MEPSKSILCSAGQTDAVLLAVVVVLLVLSAFFSCFETAISSANSIRLKSLADDNVKGARKALYLFENFDKTLTNLLVGNNLVNIANTTICAFLFSKWISNPTLANVLNTVIVTIVILIFGEILPKSFAKVNAEKMVLRFSGAMYVTCKIIAPISFIFLTIQRLCLKKVKTTDTPTVTEDELESIIDTMHEEGIIDSQDADLIQGVLDLNDRTAYDIMTPRVDVTAIQIDENIDDVKDTLLRTMYSRLPVYDKDIDHIVGILNQKDFFACLLKGNFKGVRDLITEPLFINENMKVDDIIRKMQTAKKHLAVVLDEHGGTSGIVSMEDAIEEMVGEIYDEHDDATDIAMQPMKKIDDSTYLIDAEMNLDDLFKELQIEHLPDTEYTSVGGYLFQTTEKLPQLNQTVSFKTIDEVVTDGLYSEVPVEVLFTITRIEERRIRQVKVHINRQSTEEKED